LTAALLAPKPAIGKYVKYLSQRWLAEMTSHKLPVAYGIDYAVSMDGGITHWVDCMRRNGEFLLTASSAIPARKFFAGCALAEQSGQPYMLLIEFDDGAYVVGAESAQYRLGMGVAEPCVFIEHRTLNRV
jgi:hypothetical protein